MDVISNLFDISERYFLSGGRSPNFQQIANWVPKMAKADLALSDGIFIDIESLCDSIISLSWLQVNTNYGTTRWKRISTPARVSSVLPGEIPLLTNQVPSTVNYNRQLMNGRPPESSDNAFRYIPPAPEPPIPRQMIPLNLYRYPNLFDSSAEKCFKFSSKSCHIL